MTALADQPIQTLLELVQQHKLDPWEIDIEKLAHLYLQRVREMRELDLRASGRALLSASVLLRIKSDYMLNGGFGKQTVEEELEDLLDVDLPELGRITVVQHTPRKITLAELLGALQEALAEVPAKKTPISKKMEKVIQFLSEREINIEGQLSALYERISALITSGDRVTLFTLAKERTRLAVVWVLLLLLFLCADGKVVLEQPEPFGDIVVSLPGRPHAE